MTSASRRLVLLAPSGTPQVASFCNVQRSPGLYRDMLADMQKLRGSVYLEDGAIRPEQLIGGRHILEVDEKSWHLLVLDKDDRISGCMRYRAHHYDGISFAGLNVSDSALARSQDWGHTLRNAVESELAFSRRLALPFWEIGGWALHEQLRGTMEALRMALASYSLVRVLGGGAAISTATRRNGSASILRRLGGRPLEHAGLQVPAYHEPHYDCEMEVLRFYSWAPNPRYDIWIDDLQMELRSIPVLTAGPMESAHRRPKHQSSSWISMPVVAPEPAEAPRLPFSAYIP